MRHHSTNSITAPLMARLPYAPAQALAARSLAFDLYRGVVWGDCDLELGVAGSLAQAAVGYIPVVGTLAALRDLLACLGQRDRLGIVLNLLALFPVAGGLAKTTDALHTIHRYHRRVQRRARRTQHVAAYRAVQAPAAIGAIGAVGAVAHDTHRAHRSGCASLVLSLMVVGVAALYGVGVRTLLAWLWTQGPTMHGFALRGGGAWVAPLLLFPLGLLIGLVVTVRGRLWLALTLLPSALTLGFALAR